MKTKEKLLIGLILVLFVTAAIGSLFLIDDITINYNLSDYLHEDTETKQALSITEECFGMSTDLKVMIPDISSEQAEKVADTLSEVDNVLTVTFDPASQDCYKDGNALFTLLIDGDEYSQNAKNVITDVKFLLESEHSKVHYSGTAMEKQVLQETITSEMVWILGIALLLVVVILLITAGSWLEPVVLLLSSGVAVLLNMGTNLVLGEISYITNSVAAILQLALSIDYSIVLLHTYRTSIFEHAPGFSTMLQTVKSVLRPVSASGLTTIAGLLALLFMSFRIGFDIGIVLLKGILLSLVTSLVFFPALLLCFEPLMQRTTKKAFVPKGTVFCKLAKRRGHVVIPLFLIVLIAVGILQGGITYSFSDTQGSDPIIEETFGQNNTVLLVYSSNEQDREDEYIRRVSELKKADGSPMLINATGYSNTVLKEYGPEEAQAILSLPEDDVRLLYTMYSMDIQADTVVMDAETFVTYAKDLLETPEAAATLKDAGTVAALNSMLSAKSLMESQNTSQAFLEALEQCIPTGGTSVSSEAIDQLYLLYFSTNGFSADSAILGRDFVTYLTTLCQTSPQMAAIFSEETIAGLSDLQRIDEFFLDDAECTFSQLYSRLSELGEGLKSTSVTLDESSVEGIYIKYAAEYHPELIKPISAHALLAFVRTQMDSSPLLIAAMTEENRQMVQEAEDLLSNAETMFHSKDYNRVILTLDLPCEGQDTESFMVAASTIGDEVFGQECYLAGTIPSTYDLIQTFDHDNTLISSFTIVFIFLIVMLLFRSLSLPILLVPVIQSAIWLAMTAMNLTNTSIFFMSYIMATCILMGATIDYGILMSSNYIELRKTLDRDEALERAVSGAMPTVFSSGLILIIAGLVISFISTQQAISTAGLLIGVGAAASTTFITLVLPSLLHRLDKFVIKFTMK